MQKFPYILDDIGADLRDRTFAIVIDEAHSSQGSKTSAAVSHVLAGVEADEEDTFEDQINRIIEGKKLLFVDDSIVRGTQLRETVSFLYDAGAAEVHMRSACPPIMYPCRYLNFSRGNSAMDLLARRMVQELEGNEGQKHLEEYADSRTERGKCLLHEICAQFGFDSLSYQSLDGLLEAIGLDRDKVCTYCWTGKE